MYTILRAKNEALQPAVTDFAARLVRTRSVSLDESAAADAVVTEMRQAGYDKVHRDEAGNVIGILFGRDAGPVLVLNSHLDTVVPEEVGVWAEPPCDGSIHGNRLHGAGAADCKGGLAAQVYAGILLKRSLLPLRGHLVVAATVAEENGRSIGCRHLLQRTLPALGLKPDYAVLGEPTRLGLYYGHDGWLEANIRIESANAFLVADAARAIYRDLSGVSAPAGHYAGADDLVATRPSFEGATDARCATIRVARRLRVGEDAASAVAALQHDTALLVQPTAALAVNVAVIEDEQRLYTGRTTLVRHLTNAWTTDPFDPLVERSRQALTAAGCVCRPGRWSLGRLGMGTAGSLLLGEFDIPTVGYGPGDEDLAHRADEWVDLDAVSAAVYGTAAIAHSLIGVPVCGWSDGEI